MTAHAQGWNDWASKASLVLLPLLFGGMVQLLVWVVDLRANRVTKEDMTDHMVYHASSMSAEPGREVLDALVRINGRFDSMERRLINIESRIPKQGE